MGIFDLLFKKKNEIVPINHRNEINYYTDEYFEILNNRPNIFTFYGRNADFPPYTDAYKTNENYKLRELLLLIWWGKTKSGRKIDVRIPRYFFLTYNLNAEKLTKDFKIDGLLKDEQGTTILTEKGKIYFDKYKKLWEIHSFKEIPTNLDMDFENWNKTEATIFLYTKNMEYHLANAKFCEQLIDYFSSLNKKYPSSGLSDEINYYINEKNSDISKASDYKEKISILKENN